MQQASKSPGQLQYVMDVLLLSTLLGYPVPVNNGEDLKLVKQQTLC